ncbi:hypothetical protein HpCHN1_05370 [Helicobacter pylori]
MGILWFILKWKVLFLEWLARALKRVGCKIVSRSIVLGYGVNEGHGMKLKVGSVKVGSVKAANALLNCLKFLFLGLR